MHVAVLNPRRAANIDKKTSNKRQGTSDFGLVYVQKLRKKLLMCPFSRRLWKLIATWITSIAFDPSSYNEDLQSSFVRLVAGNNKAFFYSKEELY
jgi:hypothetical protein